MNFFVETLGSVIFTGAFSLPAWLAQLPLSAFVAELDKMPAMEGTSVALRLAFLGMLAVCGFLVRRLVVERRRRG